MDAYNATWGKIDQYAGDAAAAKGTDTSYTGPGYESIADWENKKNEELAAQDAQAQRADYVPGTLRYTSDTEPVAEDRLGLWRSLTPEQKQDAISSSNVQLNNIVNSVQGVKEYNVNMAATILTGLVPLFVYFVSGRLFVRGIAAGAVKG